MHPENKRLSKEKRCHRRAQYSLGEKPALDKTSPTDVQTPASLSGTGTHYCFQFFLI
jgi:hypothetical protein